MKRKSKSLSLLLALVMALCLLSVPAMAEEEWTEVATADQLTTALQNGGNIKLTSSITVDSRQDWKITKDVTLDLAGNSITCSYNESNYFLFVVEGASLTLNDSGNGGKIEITGKDTYPLQILGSGSTFIMNGGTITAIKDAVDIYYFAENASVTINNGKLESKDYSAIAMRGSGTTVSIKDGEVVLWRPLRSLYLLYR